jgi:CHAT domain-containing protein/tetratricopeptide (TPR) repeat protein
MMDMNESEYVQAQLAELDAQIASLDRQGNFEEAIKYALISVNLTLQFFGEQHTEFASRLNNLALYYQSKENYAAAEPLFKKAVEVYRLTLGEQHPFFATSLNNLAVLYWSMGNSDLAEPLYKEALEIWRNAGAAHHDFAVGLSNLGSLYIRMNKEEEAEMLLRQALAIVRETDSETRPHLVSVLIDLANWHKEIGNHAMADFLQNQGSFESGVARAKAFLVQAILQQPLLNEESENDTDDLSKLEGFARSEIGSIGEAFALFSERNRIKLLEDSGLIHQFLSYVLKHPSQVAIASAFDYVLRRKALLYEALATQRDAVFGGKYPHLQPQLRQIALLRSQKARETLDGTNIEGLSIVFPTCPIHGRGQETPDSVSIEQLDQHQKFLVELTHQIDQLEAELARQIPEMNFEQRLREIDRQVIAMAIPEGAALIEFMKYHRFDFKAVPESEEHRYKEPHYAAFVLAGREPDNVEMIDLGEAEPIDRMIATFREIITGEEEDHSNRGLGAAPLSTQRKTDEGVGVQLRDAIFTPLLKAIGNRKRLLISPDGDLTRLPFEILPTNDGRRLIDEYRISYLGAGRDVVRFDFKSNRKPARSLVAADPDFNFGAKVIHSETATGAGRRSRDLKHDEMHFERLPGTKVEGETIAAMLDAELWTDTAALDARLKRCQSPRILHLATHGFFLEDQKRDPNEDRFGFGAMSFSETGMERLAGSRLENPLLRSGLALAGANTWFEKGELMEEAEDGLLNAEDVSGLDLLDTELVVLSACETGLGEVRTGEGVFGLRRAFVLAGAKTLVMSLWKVPDEQTRELMEDFYRRILAGQPRADALRDAQLAMKAKHPKPLYWGAFICQGDPAPLLERA